MLSDSDLQCVHFTGRLPFHHFRSNSDVDNPEPCVIARIELPAGSFPDIQVRIQG